MNNYQDDVVMGTLTVRENFMFSANVRLPSTVTKAEKDKRVDEVIHSLGLTHCAQTKVCLRLSSLQTWFESRILHCLHFQCNWRCLFLTV